MVRRTASYRLTWPPTTLTQCGVLASSRSASQTLAPELSALIDILRSVGPVISTRRSCRSCGHRRDPPVAVADRGGLRQEVQACPRRPGRPAPSAPGGEQLVAATAETAVQVGHEVERVGRQDLGRPVDVGTMHGDVGHGPNLASKRPPVPRAPWHDDERARGDAGDPHRVRRAARRRRAHGCQEPADRTVISVLATGRHRRPGPRTGAHGLPRARRPALPRLRGADPQRRHRPPGPRGPRSTRAPTSWSWRRSPPAQGEQLVAAAGAVPVVALDRFFAGADFYVSYDRVRGGGRGRRGGGRGAGPVGDGPGGERLDRGHRHRRRRAWSARRTGLRPGRGGRGAGRHHRHLGGDPGLGGAPLEGRAADATWGRSSR